MLYFHHPVLILTVFLQNIMFNQRSTFLLVLKLLPSTLSVIKKSWCRIWYRDFQSKTNTNITTISITILRISMVYYSHMYIRSTSLFSASPFTKMRIDITWITITFNNFNILQLYYQYLKNREIIFIILYGLFTFIFSHLLNVKLSNIFLKKKNAYIKSKVGVKLHTHPIT